MNEIKFKYALIDFPGGMFQKVSKTVFPQFLCALG